MATTSTLSELQRRAADGMRAYLTGPGPERTIGTKAAAEALVEARVLFTNREGEPDLLGRSYDYREFVGAALQEAAVPSDQRTNVQAAIRHHVSTILHEQYGHEMEERGLISGTSVERRKTRRGHDSRVLGLFTGGAPINDVDDASTLANVARRACGRVVTPDEAPGEARQEAVDAFRRLARAANDAARRLSAD